MASVQLASQHHVGARTRRSHRPRRVLRRSPPKACLVNYLAIPAEQIDKLAQELLSAAPLESGAFALLYEVRRGRGRRLILGNRVRLDQEWEAQDEGRLRPSGQMISAAVSAANAAGAGLAFIHTHPFGSTEPRLSAIDEETSVRLGKALRELIDGPFASLVLGPGGWGGALGEDVMLEKFTRIALVRRTLTLYVNDTQTVSAS